MKSTLVHTGLAVLLCMIVAAQPTEAAGEKVQACLDDLKALQANKPAVPAKSASKQDKAKFRKASKAWANKMNETNATCSKLKRELQKKKKAK